MSRPVLEKEVPGGGNLFCFYCHSFNIISAFSLLPLFVFHLKFSQCKQIVAWLGGLAVGNISQSFQLVQSISSLISLSICSLLFYLEVESDKPFRAVYSLQLDKLYKI